MHIPAESLQFIDGFGSGGWSAGGDVHGREACPTFVHPCTSTRESPFFLVLCIGTCACMVPFVQELLRTRGSTQLQDVDFGQSQGCMLENQGTYQTLRWESEMGFSPELYCFSVLQFLP